MSYVNPHQQQQPVLAPYINIVNTTFLDSVNKLLGVSNLPDQISNAIYQELKDTGYDLVTDVLTYLVGTQGWNQGAYVVQIENSIQFVIYNEALRYGYNVGHFEKAAQWVNSLRPYVEAFINERLAMQRTTQMQPAQMQGGIGRNMVPPPNMATPAHSGFNNYQMPQVTTTNEQRNSPLFNAGATSVNKPIPITPPTPEAIPVIIKPTVTPIAIPHKVDVSTIKITDARIDTPEAPITAQMATILELTEMSAIPLLANYYREIILPVFNEYNMDLLPELDKIAATDSLVVLTDIFTILTDTWNVGRLTQYFKQVIERAMVTALVYRYGIAGLNSFPYFTMTEQCTKFLHKEGIFTEIELIALEAIRPIIPTLNFTTTPLVAGVEVPNLETVENRITLNATIINDILILPDAYAYDYKKMMLTSNNTEINDSVTATLQAAFKMVDPTTVVIELIDATLCRYKVAMYGVPSDCNAFKVKPM